MSYFKNTNISSPLSPFGEMLSVSPEPLIQVTTPYGINSEKITTSATGAGAGVTWAAGLMTIASGTANSGTAAMISKDVARYGAGQGMDVRFACLFSAPNAENTIAAGIGNGTDGYFFGYNGTAFGVLRKSGGSDNWVAQTAWSVDKMAGAGPSGMTLDKTKGNVYRIQYQWLGFGMITFSIENSVTGTFQVVHQIQYANANTGTSITNPTVPFEIRSTNTASGVTSVTCSCGSFAVFVTGDTVRVPFVRFSTGNSKTGLTTENSVITLKNKGTNVLGGTNTNRSPIQIDWISAAASGSKPAVIRAVLNTALGGVPSYADISTNASVCSVDIAGTTLTGGTEKWSMALGPAGNAHNDVSNLKIMVYPGDIMAFTGQGASSADISIRIGWRELQ